MEVEKGAQVRLAVFEQPAEEERQEIREHEEDQDEDVSERRGEITRELAAEDYHCHGVPPGFHGDSRKARTPYGWRREARRGEEVFTVTP